MLISPLGIPCSDPPRPPPLTTAIGCECFDHQPDQNILRSTSHATTPDLMVAIHCCHLTRIQPLDDSPFPILFFLALLRKLHPMPGTRQIPPKVPLRFIALRLRVVHLVDGLHHKPTSLLHHPPRHNPLPPCPRPPFIPLRVILQQLCLMPRPSFVCTHVDSDDSSATTTESIPF